MNGGSRSAASWWARLSRGRCYDGVVGAFALSILLLGLSQLPAFQAGTELRVVSPDLLTVYSSGRVQDGVLTIDLPLDAGTEVRVVAFAPGASDEQMALALSGGAALRGRVAPDRADIVLLLPEGSEPVSLREWLREEYGITLILVTRRSR
jgi:hypothetical protein